MITPDQIQAWLAHPVTRAIYEIAAERVNTLKEDLSRVAGHDSGTDRYVTGEIRGLQEFMEIPKEFQEEEKVDDEGSRPEIDYSSGEG